MSGRRISMGVAAVLLAAAAWGWVRSWDAADAVWMQRGAGTSVALGASEGAVFVAGYVPLVVESDEPARWEAGTFPVGRSARYPILGRQASGSTWAARVGLERVRMLLPWRRAGEVPGTYLPAFPEMAMARAVYLPYWVLVLSLSAMLGRWMFQEGAERRERTKGRCPGCGYDLRASPERCPECGRAVGHADAKR